MKRKHSLLQPATQVVIVLTLIAGCSAPQEPAPGSNPFFAALNEPVPYADVTAQDISGYADSVIARTERVLAGIHQVTSPTFGNVVAPFDAVTSELSKAGSNSWMMYWVSPDSTIRAMGLEQNKRLDSLSTALYADHVLYEKLVAVQRAGGLEGSDVTLLDDLVASMKQSGAELAPEDLERYTALRAELNDLVSEYSTNMNTDIPTLVLDEAGADGLPENFKSAYAKGDGTYEIPVMPATAGPVMNNATSEQTRRRYYFANGTRAASANLPILDKLVAKRHELAAMLGYPSFADLQLELRMARTPNRVWAFLDDLTIRTADKARLDVARVAEVQDSLNGGATGSSIEPWNVGYLHNTLLKTRYGVDAEKIREYLPLDAALKGMMDLYQGLLGYEFRKVEHPSVWHEEVEAYDVFEDDMQVGRFYLDLFPRPNKESWFYGVPLTPGRTIDGVREMPVTMLLGNFTRPTDEVPSLVSHAELRTLFHEFGHIMNSVSYRGEYALQADSKADFGEAMSQIFENWIWEYDVLGTFARHYRTGEVLPRELFDAMLAARNVGSGLNAQRSQERAVYDLTLYNRFDPDHPFDTDQLWTDIAPRFVYAPHVDGIHTQASWIHINTHPVYYYGYLWSAVYAADMFTRFEENGLYDAGTGRRYRDLILANGTQRAIDDVVEEFLGRPMNSEAYIKSLGLE